MAEGGTGTPDPSLDPRRLRRGLLAAVGIGLAVALTVVLLSDGPAVMAGVERLPLVWLLLALALSVGSWFGQGIGFAALTDRGLRGYLLPMTRAFLGGDFPALVTPFGSGGIPGGVFALTREGLSAGDASAIITMHSLLTGVFFVIVGAVAALLLPLKTLGSSELVWGGLLSIVAGVAFILWVSLRPERATALLGRLLESGAARRLIGLERSERAAAGAEREAGQFATSVGQLIRERPGALALSFAGLFASRVLLMFALPIVMYGLGWRGDVAPLLASAVGAMALTIASPTPGGSGAVEAALTALLATQTAGPMAAAAALLWRGITYYTELLAGYAAFSHYLAKERTVARPPA